MTKKANKQDEEKKALEKDIDEWKNKYLRALADYQNLEKRVDEHNEQIRKKANRNLIVKFLTILEDLEQAGQFINDPGLQLVKNKFVKILDDEGVTEINLLGKPYDPYLAECVEIVAGKKDNQVIAVVRKGYKLNNELIQPARVKVSKLLSVNT